MSSITRRWAELVADPKWGAMPNKSETDLSPPADGDHGDRQAEIVYQLKGWGRGITKCGVSTSAGTKVPDVAWFSPEHRLVLEAGILAAKPAPEICVEILSLDDTGKEILEKAALYFEAGAREVWICDLEGKVCFLSQSAELSISSLFPRFFLTGPSQRVKSQSSIIATFSGNRCLDRVESHPLADKGTRQRDQNPYRREKSIDSAGISHPTAGIPYLS